MFQQAERARQLWEWTPRVVRSVIHRNASTIHPARRALTWLDGDLLSRYERVRVLYDEAAKLALYTPSTVSAMAAPEPSIRTLARYMHPMEADAISQLTRLELKNYMAHTLLRDTDAMSMAHSLEVRVPLIDHKLVEFAVRIPALLKLRQGRTKYIFAQALRDVLPADILRRPKRGFEMPVAAWMRTELREVVEDTLSKKAVERRGLFRQEEVQRLYRSFIDGNSPYMWPWVLVVLELWMRQFIDKRPH
jgi:asparagine synthase (glutamine-hydrolysing)